MIVKIHQVAVLCDTSQVISMIRRICHNKLIKTYNAVSLLILTWCTILTVWALCIVNNRHNEKLNISDRVPDYWLGLCTTRTSSSQLALLLKGFAREQ